MYEAGFVLEMFPKTAVAPCGMSKLYKALFDHLRQNGLRSMMIKVVDWATGCPIGSESWLVATENYFGGLVTNVARRTVSEFDPRTPDQLATGGMIGGDRMLHHGYGKYYAKHLQRFVARRCKTLTIVEIGILRGTGLALWSKLFPNADIIGLDIDLSHFNENLAFLKSKGAFERRNVEVHIFDQFKNNTQSLREILGHRKVDIAIDDGFHLDETILATARSLKPYLKQQFVYFAEDNRRVHAELKKEFSDCTVRSYDELTVVFR